MKKFQELPKVKQTEIASVVSRIYNEAADISAVINLKNVLKELEENALSEYSKQDIEITKTDFDEIIADTLLIRFNESIQAGRLDLIKKFDNDLKLPLYPGVSDYFEMIKTLLKDQATSEQIDQAADKESLSLKKQPIIFLMKRAKKSLEAMNTPINKRNQSPKLAAKISKATANSPTPKRNRKI